jgi:hypothetical protein
MAWSPVRRTNAGRFEVDHPGDYATLNSYHPVDENGLGRDCLSHSDVLASWFIRHDVPGGDRLRWDGWVHDQDVVPRRKLDHRRKVTVMPSDCRRLRRNWVRLTTSSWQPPKSW